MALKQSLMLALGTRAPDFALPDAVIGNSVALKDFADSPALLVAFICNHCPYVKHVLDGFLGFVRDYALRGLAVVAISSNDVEAYPEDAPAEMAKLAKARGFTIPYLYDETQAVARAYQAVCTPDFFLFDRDRCLVYRGRFDNSRPGNNVAVTGVDLGAAVEALLKGRAVAAAQIPSVGCNIKWKAGREPQA